MSSRTIYQNQYVEIRVDTVRTTGGIREYAYFIRPANRAVGIIAIDSDGICLVRQYRYIARQWLWQIPMGASSGSNPLICAQNELKEETGITASSWKKLGLIRPEPGMTPQSIYIFLAQGFSFGKQELECSEVGMQVRRFSLRHVDNLIAKGKITCGYTLSAWQLYLSKIKPKL